jgi:hypothetical protein
MVFQAFQASLGHWCCVKILLANDSTLPKMWLGWATAPNSGGLMWPKSFPAPDSPSWIAASPEKPARSLVHMAGSVQVTILAQNLAESYK